MFKKSFRRPLGFFIWCPPWKADRAICSMRSTTNYKLFFFSHGTILTALMKSRKLGTKLAKITWLGLVPYTYRYHVTKTRLPFHSLHFQQDTNWFPHSLTAQQPGPSLSHSPSCKSFIDEVGHLLEHPIFTPSLRESEYFYVCTLSKSNSQRHFNPLHPAV